MLIDNCHCGIICYPLTVTRLGCCIVHVYLHPNDKSNHIMIVSLRVSLSSYLLITLLNVWSCAHCVDKVRLTVFVCGDVGASDSAEVAGCPIRSSGWSL